MLRPWMPGENWCPSWLLLGWAKDFGYVFVPFINSITALEDVKRDNEGSIDLMKMRIKL